MNTVQKGTAFEMRAFKALKSELEAGRLGLRPECAKIFMRQPYYSAKRGANIIFDIAIEVTLPGAVQPSFYWLWECKDYTSAVPVNDLEEFAKKVEQVTDLNVKAGFISTTPLQESAANFAEASRMAVIRMRSADTEAGAGSHLEHLCYTFVPALFALNEIVGRDWRGATSITHHRILFIEDEPDYREFITDYVKMSGMDLHLVTASGPDEALEQLRADLASGRPYTAVILDIAMAPGRELHDADTRAGTWTGVHLYQRLGEWLDKFDFAWPKLPVIVHTHITDEALRNHLEELHRVVWPKLPILFLYKPMLPGEFFERARGWLSRIWKD